MSQRGPHHDEILRLVVSDERQARRVRRRKTVLDEITIAEGATSRAVAEAAGRGAKGGAVAIGTTGILLAPSMGGVAVAQEAPVAPTAIVGVVQGVAEVAAVPAPVAPEPPAPTPAAPAAQAPAVAVPQPETVAPAVDTAPATAAPAEAPGPAEAAGPLDTAASADPAPSADVAAPAESAVPAADAGDDGVPEGGLTPVDEAPADTTAGEVSGGEMPADGATTGDVPTEPPALAATEEEGAADVGLPEEVGPEETVIADPGVPADGAPEADAPEDGAAVEALVPDATPPGGPSADPSPGGQSAAPSADGGAQGSEPSTSGHSPGTPQASGQASAGTPPAADEEDETVDQQLLISIGEAAQEASTNGGSGTLHADGEQPATPSADEQDGDEADQGEQHGGEQTPGELSPAAGGVGVETSAPVLSAPAATAQQTAPAPAAAGQPLAAPETQTPLSEALIEDLSSPSASPSPEASSSPVPAVTQPPTQGSAPPAAAVAEVRPPSLPVVPELPADPIQQAAPQVTAPAPGPVAVQDLVDPPTTAAIGGPDRPITLSAADQAPAEARPTITAATMSAAPAAVAPPTPSPRSAAAVDPVFSPNSAPAVAEAPEPQTPAAPSLADQLASARQQPVDAARVGRWSRVVLDAWTAKRDGRSVSGPRAVVSAEITQAPLLGATYEVQPGDSLWTIASRLWGDAALTQAELEATWQLLYAWNADALGNDPDNVVAGVLVEIPADLEAM